MLDGISAAAGMIIRKSSSTGRLPNQVWDTASLQLFSLLSDDCSDDLLERKVGGGSRGGGVVILDVDLKVLQSIAGIR